MVSGKVEISFLLIRMLGVKHSRGHLAIVHKILVGFSDASG